MKIDPTQVGIFTGAVLGLFGLMLVAQEKQEMPYVIIGSIFALAGVGVILKTVGVL